MRPGLKILDHVALAVSRAEKQGPQAIREYFLEEMTVMDAVRFDWFLLKMEDELAQMEGPTEARFVERCTRMLKAREVQG